MVKRIGRRFVSLLLTFVTILTMLPAMTLPALAATNRDLTGLADPNIGLSFSGKAENAWSASGTQIVGSATSTGGSCGSTDYSSTLTITNKKSTTATLSFDYAIEQNSGTIQVDGTAVTKNGKFSKELAQNASIKVNIKSGSTSAATKITLTNVVLVAEYLALPAEKRTTTQLAKMAKGYLSRANALEKECDGKMDEVIRAMETLIRDNNGDLTLVDTVVYTYANEKSLKKSWYMSKLEQKGLL